MIAVAAIVVAILALTHKNGETADNNVTSITNESTSAKKLTDSISLPGYGYLNLKADTTEQDLALSNPEENFCYIKISIIMEDGTVLWTSDLIAPGEKSAPIVLKKPLAAGEYKNAVLKYECFKMDENLSPLNGASSRLTLKVK